MKNKPFIVELRRRIKDCELKIRADFFLATAANAEDIVNKALKLARQISAYERVIEVLRVDKEK